jgi:hypothetical protein
MDDFSKPKATLVIKVMEHGTITGAEGAGHLEFDDCVNAVTGLIDWMARSLAEANEADREQVGTEILVAALNSWTFEQQMDASEEDEDLLDEDLLDEGEDDEDGPDEDDSDEEFPPN